MMTMANMFAMDIEYYHHLGELGETAQMFKLYRVDGQWMAEPCNKVGDRMVSSDEPAGAPAPSADESENVAAFF